MSGAAATGGTEVATGTGTGECRPCGRCGDHPAAEPSLPRTHVLPRRDRDRDYHARRDRGEDGGRRDHPHQDQRRRRQEEEEENDDEYLKRVEAALEEARACSSYCCLGRLLQPPCFVPLKKKWGSAAGSGPRGDGAAADRGDAEETGGDPAQVSSIRPRACRSGKMG